MLLSGLPGAGKSTLARALATRAGFSVIRSDEVRKELAGRVGGKSGATAFGEDIYTPEWDERTYAECLRRAEEIVFQAGRALVDASFRDEARRRHFLDAARHWGVTGGMLVLRADVEIVRRRLAGRRDDASDAGWSVYQEAARRWDEPGDATRALTSEIDAGAAPEQTLERALGALRKVGLIEEPPR
jgi:predicted kinase